MEAAAAAAAAARFLAGLPIALNGAAPGREIAAAVAALSEAASGYPEDPGSFAAALTLAWRALALFGDAVTTPGMMRDTLLTAGAEGFTLTGVGEAVAIAAALSAVVLRGDYPARQDASAERTRLREAVAPVIEIAGALGDQVQLFINEVSGDAARALSQIAASRAPLVRVETGVSLSAIRVAHELYGDANRAGELVARNRVATAVFMPVGFEAVSV